MKQQAKATSMTLCIPDCKLSQGSKSDSTQRSFSSQKNQKTTAMITRKNKKRNDANLGSGKISSQAPFAGIKVQVQQLEQHSYQDQQSIERDLTAEIETFCGDSGGDKSLNKNIIVQEDRSREKGTSFQKSYKQDIDVMKQQNKIAQPLQKELEEINGSYQESDKKILKSSSSSNLQEVKQTSLNMATQPKVNKKKKKSSSSNRLPSFLRQLMSLNTSQQTVNDIVRRNRKQKKLHNPKRACNRRKEVEKTRNSQRLKRKQEHQKDLAVQDSEQQLAIALAIQMSTNAMQNAEDELKEQLKEIEETYTHFASEQQIQSPILMIEKLYQIQQLWNYGTIKIVPPPSFKPPCMLDFDFKLPLPTRKQKLEELSQGKGFKQNYKGHEFVQFREKADKFAESQERYNKFEEVENIAQVDDEIDTKKNQLELLNKDKRQDSQQGSIQTNEQIEEIQFDYWKKVELIRGQPVQVQYAADLPSKSYGSGFPRKYHSNSKFFKHCPQDWLQQCKTDQNEFEKYMHHPSNLNNINNQEGSFLSFFQSHHQQGISGITTPWTYVGMKYATFCWHTQDLMMYSLNYMHKGCAKIWYVIPEYHANKFERVVKSKLSSLKKDQPNFIHHMTTMVSPKYLRANGVDVRKLIQRPGEFVITFPRSYHAGFSTGFNIAEAVNFGSNSWLQHGIDAFDIYRKTKEVIPIFSLEWMLYENIQKFQQEEEEEEQKKQRELVKRVQKRNHVQKVKNQEDFFDIRSDSQNESLQFLNDILNKPMKNFRQRGDEDEFANIYELNSSQDVKLNDSKPVNKRNMKANKKQSPSQINSQSSLEQIKSQEPSAFNFQQFRKKNSKEYKENILKQGARVIQNEIRQRKQLIQQLKRNKVNWKEDKMSQNTPYDKYDCSFCTDLPFFSVMIYEGQKVEGDQLNQQNQKNQPNISEESIESMRGKKNRKKKQNFNQFLGSKKPLKSCLHHGHLQKIAQFNKNQTLLIRVSQDELNRKLEFIEEQLRLLQNV